MHPNKEQFSKEFPLFLEKIEKFVQSQNFTEKTKEYTDLFNQMASVSPDDMKEYIQKAPEFLQARNTSLELMERVVALHLELEKIFGMDEETLGKTYEYNLNAVDEMIAGKLKEAATLLHQFSIASEKGRQAIERANDPFLSQANN